MKHIQMNMEITLAHAAAIPLKWTKVAFEVRQKPAATDQMQVACSPL
jgi:hypothetical protein